MTTYHYVVAFDNENAPSLRAVNRRFGGWADFNIRHESGNISQLVVSNFFSDNDAYDLVEELVHFMRSIGVDVFYSEFKTGAP